eukprot:scaffold24690_cov33-Tisochrysis_lutea.AAC.1
MAHAAHNGHDLRALTKERRGMALEVARGDLRRGGDAALSRWWCRSSLDPLRLQAQCCER